MNCYCWYTERFTRWTQLSSEFLEIQLQLGASEANKLITGLHYQPHIRSTCLMSEHPAPGSLFWLPSTRRGWQDTRSILVSRLQTLTTDHDKAFWSYQVSLSSYSLNNFHSGVKTTLASIGRVPRNSWVRIFHWRILDMWSFYIGR